MKVRDLLLPHLFPDFKLIGGANGIDRELKNIAVFDTPDMSYWVQGGEFLIGNGFIFKDTIEDIHVFLKKVSEKDVAAVGIKFDRFAAFIDMHDISQMADKLRLPIFRIPFRYRWLDIILKVVAERDRLSGAGGAQGPRDKSFLDELDSISALLQEMAERIGKPVYFFSRAGDDGTIFWPGSKTGFKSGESIESYKNANVEGTNFLSGMSDFIGIREEKRLMQNPVRSRVYFTNVPQPFELHVISETESGLSGNEEKMLRRCLTALKALLTEQLELSSLQHREISQILERLLLGSYSDSKTLVQALKKWDLVQPIPCRIALIPRHDVGSELIGHSDLPYRFTCTMGKYHVLLIPWELEPYSEKNEMALGYLEKYEETVALGGIAKTVEDIPGSFRDAQRLLAYMQKMAVGKKVFLYESMAPQILLAGSAVSDDAPRIWLKYWKPLKEMKQSSMVKPVDFASGLIEANFNLAECSGRLNIHYNTARKYADTIENVLGESLQDFKTQICLYIGKSVDHEMTHTK